MAYTYYNQPHLFPPNPYPHPPPPPIAHKVWILDCKSCGTFLTNRAMKAVLLLRPNVSLFSSDALPVNCSAYSANPDALRCRSPCRPTSSSVPPRTCECLTQTLCCHGCGNTIGYMIVIPCTRCTSSISATNRATNGHRFVFHSSEVVGMERHYIQDEPGVIPFEPTGVAAASGLPTTILDSSGMTNGVQRAEFHISLARSHTRQESPSPESIPTPTLEQANPLATTDPSLSPPDLTSSQQFLTYLRPYASDSTPSSSSSSTSSGSRSTSGRRSTAGTNPSSSSDSNPPPLVSATYLSSSPPVLEQKDLPTSRALKPGDVLFWHHLARCGEIPGVEDDKRARSKAGAMGETKNIDTCLTSAVDGNNMKRKGRSLGRVVFGR